MSNEINGCYINESQVAYDLFDKLGINIKNSYSHMVDVMGGTIFFVHDNTLFVTDKFPISRFKWITAPIREITLTDLEQQFNNKGTK